MNKTKDKLMQMSIDFLLYYGIGITTSELNDIECIKTCAIDRAYTDATLEGAYNTIPKNKDDKDEYKKATLKIREFLASLGEKEIDYDKEFGNLLDEVVKCYDSIKKVNTEENAFTYGNAQKWCNMTMKYLAIISSFAVDWSGNEDVKEFCESIISKYEKFHAPIDSYIIEALWNNKSLPYKGTVIDGLPVWGNSSDEHKKGEPLEEYKSDRVVAWSNWDSENYDKLRSEMPSIKNDEIELVWENRKWIEVSRKRKNH